MTITTAINSTFAHLNDDRSYLRKREVPSREREVIVDIVIDAETYVTGGITVDLSGIANFKQVYILAVKNNDTPTLLTTFVPGTNNDSATGRIQLFVASTGSEQTEISTTLTLRCEMRGI